LARSISQAGAVRSENTGFFIENQQVMVAKFWNEDLQRAGAIYLTEKE
jgi:hypothetical protein